MPADSRIAALRAKQDAMLAAEARAGERLMPTKTEAPAAKADNRPFAIRRYSPTDLRAALKKMYLIRRFEERAEAATCAA